MTFLRRAVLVSISASAIRTPRPRGADEDRIEIDRRELAIGRHDEFGEAHAAIDQRVDIARRRAAESVEQLRHFQARRSAVGDVLGTTPAAAAPRHP